MVGFYAPLKASGTDKTLKVKDQAKTHGNFSYTFQNSRKQDQQEYSSAVCYVNSTYANLLI